MNLINDTHHLMMKKKNTQILVKPQTHNWYTLQEVENQPSGYQADGPLPPPGRSSRKALSKIGDMFQNSPFGKSGKPLCTLMNGLLQSFKYTVHPDSSWRAA